MKKILFLTLTALLLNGCSEKDTYEAAVLAQLQLEKASQNAKDYNIPAEKMATCIVDASSSNMPGLFLLDPARLTAYRNYTKMLTLAQSADPKKTMDELRNDFGSPKDLAAARSNYTESEMECLETFMETVGNGDKSADTESK